MKAPGNRKGGTGDTRDARFWFLVPYDRGVQNDQTSGARGAGTVVDRLMASVGASPGVCRVGAAPPRVKAVHRWVELTRRVVFVGYFERRDLAADGLRPRLERLVERVREVAEAQLERALRYEWEGAHGCAEGAKAGEFKDEARRMASALVEALPALREALALDVQAAFEGDPAARSVDEVALCYPGVDAVFVHRLAHLLHGMGAPLIPRMMSEIAHNRTGIDIHPGAKIGPSFFIDHGTGVVIGETAEIGERVKIYQGVTIGARSIERDESGRVVRGKKRHPTIGNRVTIYADSVILGGDTVVGDDCVVSGAVFLTQSAPAGHIVRAKQPEIVLRTNREAGR